MTPLNKDLIVICTGSVTQRDPFVGPTQVERIRRQIDAGTYLTAKKIDAAIIAMANLDFR